MSINRAEEMFVMKSLLNICADLNLSDRPAAFIDVNVISMNNNRILENQTVIIKNGLIDTIGNSRHTPVPVDALPIKSEKKYLLPGLVDMHVHFNSFAPFFGVKNEWALYIANGITSVRNMWGIHIGWYHPFLNKCKKIPMCNIPIPNVYTGGQILESKPQFFPPLSKLIENPNNAKKFVEYEKKKGYEFIKIYHTLSEDSYMAVSKAAKELSIPFLGHVPDVIGIDGAIKAGQHSIEHLIGFFNPFTGKTKTDIESVGQYGSNLRDAGIWNCPTMVVWQRYLSPDKVNEFDKKNDMRYLQKKYRYSMKKALIAASSKLIIPDNYEDYQKHVVGELHKAGARILLGTDSPNPYIVPGFSAHEELENLVEAGLTPFEAIKAGTKNAAECLNRLNEFGTISVGKRADMLFLDKNPLDDIKNLKSIAGVMVRGTWLPKSALDTILDAMVTN